MRVLRWVLAIASALLLVVTPVLWIIAVWTVGDNSGRLGGTGALTLTVGIVFAGAALLCWL